jgi:Lrp/AsnC family leucine-responsive transcriptional regulator
MSEDVSELDDIGWDILLELEQDARMSFTELGRRVGLSTPTVEERVRKMEDAGIIVGYRAVVDPSRIGLTILAFIRVSVVGDSLDKIGRLANELPEVLECHRVTGADSLILKVAISSIKHLESVIDQFTPGVATTTSIVLSSAVSSVIVERARACAAARQNRDRLLEENS